MTGQLVRLATEEGLAYDFGRAVYVSTFDAHGLNQLARTHGIGTRMHEQLMRADLIEGAVVDDVDALVRLGAETGVPADEIRKVLAGDAYAADVRKDMREAQQLGAPGVPFLLLNGAFGLSGAQPVEALFQALRTADAVSASAAG